ncbi:MAG TPA: DNA-processing protein DprA [Myxococcota bacterium]|nr:DNA-processing protein DprA [Myxococcota bacterium]HRY94777.1 DNA-processing protein DprA [Myxococcota bacterium]HSA22698.1 DNA-processing protein DprA [Myxococcota bacterium]
MKAAADTPRVLTPGQPGFPPELAALRDAPACLWLRGELPPGPRVAVVGARRADAYGLQAAAELGAGLARAGVPVVSGGAAGVDTAALEACLQAGGRPVAVLGTGVDVAYPTGNQALFARLAAEGALLSEYPPGSQGLRHHFPERNRLVAALAAAVVVVRAAPRSGSLITARLARAQGRPVLAVPGPAGEELSAGCHALLRQGAQLVEGPADVLGALGLDGRRAAASARPAGAPPGPALEPDERELWEALGAEACPVDTLVDRTGWGSARVAALLLQMECKGLVEHRPGMRYCRGAPRAASGAGQGASQA